ncbi:unnamed protein product, partial [Mesorhabditis spiculigera]
MSQKSGDDDEVEDLEVAAKLARDIEAKLRRVSSGRAKRSEIEELFAKVRNQIDNYASEYSRDRKDGSKSRASAENQPSTSAMPETAVDEDEPLPSTSWARADTPGADQMFAEILDNPAVCSTPDPEVLTESREASPKIRDRPTTSKRREEFLSEESQESVDEMHLDDDAAAAGDGLKYTRLLPVKKSKNTSAFPKAFMQLFSDSPTESAYTSSESKESQAPDNSTIELSDDEEIPETVPCRTPKRAPLDKTFSGDEDDEETVRPATQESTNSFLNKVKALDDSQKLLTPVASPIEKQRSQQEVKSEKLSPPKKRPAQKGPEPPECEVIILSDGPMEEDGDSDHSVVSDEDLRLQAEIRKEHGIGLKKKKKSSKKKDSPKKKKKKPESDEGSSDSELDELLSKSKKALKKPKFKKKGSGEATDEDEIEEVSSDSVFSDGDSDKPKKNGKESSANGSPSKSSNGNGRLFRSTKHRSAKEKTRKQKDGSGSGPSEEGSDSEEDDDKEKSPRLGLKPDKDLQKAKRLLDSLDSDGSDEENGNKAKKHKEKSKSSGKKRKVVILSDSDFSGKGEAEESEDDEASDNSNASSEEKEVKKPAAKRARLVEDDDDDDSAAAQEKKKARGSKALLTKDKLAKETVDAEKAEKERRKRLEIKQREFNGIELAEEEDLAAALEGSQKRSVLKNVILDPDRNGDPPMPVAIHQSLVNILKKHQAEGIRFMYDSIFESLDRLEEEGGGGILAHCMGLGKTLQVITFLHTIMMHEKLGQKIKHVLVVVPKNVVLNWFKEFAKWLLNNDPELDTIEVMELDSFKTNADRHRALKNWYESEYPCVMIIGYDMFRQLTVHEEDQHKAPKRAGAKPKPARKPNKKMAKFVDDFRYYLQDPGPDLVVCDEAHKLKNSETTLTKTMVKIKTRRRLCLTGTPLQNNLNEYHCMVDFVKPDLLGSKKEFANRFGNPIERGRTKDATDAEFRFMKRRCHVLFETLKKCVDRKDYTVLMEAIPPKQEYMLNVSLTEAQCKLYRGFLDNVDKSAYSKRLLADYYMLARIWTHPHQLIVHGEAMERKRMMEDDREEEEDFIDDGSGTDTDEESVKNASDSDVICEDDAPTSSRKTRNSRRLAGDSASEDGLREGTPRELTGWFTDQKLVSSDDKYKWELSNKLMLLIQIIKKCEEIGDKLLVFSQSLESLGLIKEMLTFFDQTQSWFTDGHEALNGNEHWGWKENRDYLWITGAVNAKQRDKIQTQFNNPSELRPRLMLISTKAGSLGTNMVAANRVVIFDACWNPSHDTQSLFRVYRFGQTKPVYIYRMIAQGTMEETIYKRQVIKESTSMRVVDEAQIMRHYEGSDLAELYQFNPKELKGGHQRYAPPQDRLLADVLHKLPDAITDYVQHDTLFHNIVDEKLTEDEIQEAWADYEQDKKVPRPYSNFTSQWHNPQMNGLNADAQRVMDAQSKINQLRADPVYFSCFTLGGMDNDTATKVTWIKRALDELLPRIPAEMRGGIGEFSTYFIKLINASIGAKERPPQLFQKSVNAFRSVVKMVFDVPECRELLRRLYPMASPFFDPNMPPP